MNAFQVGGAGGIASGYFLRYFALFSVKIGPVVAKIQAFEVLRGPPFPWAHSNLNFGTRVANVNHIDKNMAGEGPDIF